LIQSSRYTHAVATYVCSVRGPLSPCCSPSVIELLSTSSRVVCALFVTLYDSKFFAKCPREVLERTNLLTLTTSKLWAHDRLGNLAARSYQILI
jgi:hypothetical protein